MSDSINSSIGRIANRDTTKNLSQGEMRRLAGTSKIPGEEDPEIRQAVETRDAKQAWKRESRSALRTFLEQKIHNTGYSQIWKKSGVAYCDEISQKDGLKTLRKNLWEYVQNRRAMHEEFANIDSPEALNGALDDETLRSAINPYAIEIAEYRKKLAKQIETEYDLNPGEGARVTKWVRMQEISALREFLTSQRRADLHAKLTKQTRNTGESPHIRGILRGFEEILEELQINPDQMPRYAPAEDISFMRRVLSGSRGDVAAHDVERLIKLLEKYGVFWAAYNTISDNRTKVMTALYERFLPRIGLSTLYKGEAVDISEGKNIIDLSEARDLVESGIADLEILVPDGMNPTKAIDHRLEFFDDVIIDRAHYGMLDHIGIQMDELQSDKPDIFQRLLDNPKILYETIADRLTEYKRMPSLEHPETPDDAKPPEHAYDWIYTDEDDFDEDGEPKAFEGIDPATLRKRLIDRLRSGKHRGVELPEIPDDQLDTLADGAYIVGHPGRDSREKLGDRVYMRIDTLDSGGVLAPYMQLRTCTTNGLLDRRDPTDEMQKSDVEYNQFLVMLTAFERIEILNDREIDERIELSKRDPAGLTAEEQAQAIGEAIPETQIGTLSDLTYHINRLDTSRNISEFGVDTCFEIGEADPEAKIEDSRYRIFVIQGIDEQRQRIYVSNGHGREEITFSDFLRAFRGGKGKRLPNPANGGFLSPECVIKNMSALLGEDAKWTNSAEAWKWMEYRDGGQQEAHGFVKPNEEGASEAMIAYSYFQSTKGNSTTLIEVQRSDQNEISFTVYEGFTEEKVGEETDNKPMQMKRSSSGRLRYHRVWYPAFLRILRIYGCVPRRRPEEEALRQAKDFSNVKPMNEGIFGWMKNGISLSTVLQGAKFFGESIKEKFSNQDDTQAAKLAYWLSGAIPDFLMGEDDKLSLMQHVQSKNDAVVDKIKDKLSKNISGERRRRIIRRILLSPRSKKLEVMAALLVCLERTGTLYAESYLQDLEGTGIFFKRLLGLPMSADHTQHPKWIKYRQKAIDDKRTEKLDPKTGDVADQSASVHEIDIIVRWAQAEEDKLGVDFIANFKSKIWGTLEEGRANATEKGRREVGQFSEVESQVTHVIGKLKSGLVSEAIGDPKKDKDGAGMWKIIDKGGDDNQNMAVPFALIMSGLPEVMDAGHRKRLRVNYIIGKKLLYSPLRFIDTIDHVNLYRQVVEQLIRDSGDPEGIKLIGTLNELRAMNNPGKEVPNPDEKKRKATPMVSQQAAMVLVADQIWRGGVAKRIGLHEKLNIFRDRTMLDLENQRKHPIYKQYAQDFIQMTADWRAWSDGSPQTGAIGGEIWNDIYMDNHTPGRVDAMTSWIQIDTNTGAFLDKTSWDLFFQIKSNFKMIRTMLHPQYRDRPDHPEHTAYRKKLFAEYQHAMAEVFRRKMGGSGIDLTEEEHINDLIQNYGFDRRLFLSRKVRADEDIEIIETNLKKDERYIYAESGRFDQYIEDAGDRHETRSFEDRFAIFMDEWSTPAETHDIVISTEQILSQWREVMDSILKKQPANTDPADIHRRQWVASNDPQARRVA